MCQAAGYIYRKLVNDGILNQAFSVAPVRSENEVRCCIAATGEAVVFYFSWTPAGKSCLEGITCDLWDGWKTVLQFSFQALINQKNIL